MNGEIFTIIGVGMALGLFVWRVSARLDRRIDRLEARFDSRLDRIDGRFDRVDDRMDRIDGRIDRVDDRMDRIDGRIDGLVKQLHAMAREFSELRGEIRKDNSSS